MQIAVHQSGLCIQVMAHSIIKYSYFIITLLKEVNCNSKTRGGGHVIPFSQIFMCNHPFLCRILCWFQICNRFFSTTKTKLPMWPFTIERFLRLWAKSVIFRYFQGVSNIVNMHIKLKEIEFWYHLTLNKTPKVI